MMENIMPIISLCKEKTIVAKYIKDNLKEAYWISCSNFISSLFPLRYLINSDIKRIAHIIIAPPLIYCNAPLFIGTIKVAAKIIIAANKTTVVPNIKISLSLFISRLMLPNDFMFIIACLDKKSK